jgi:hypothetical protein
VAAAKALRQSGAGTLFATVDDLAAAAGKKIPVSNLPGIWADDLVPAIRALGGKVKDLGTPTSMEHLMRTGQDLKRFQAMLFAVEWKTVAGTPAGHTLYLFKDGLGRLRISDRTGHVVKALVEYEKLVPSWKGIGGAQVMTRPGKGSMLLIEGAQMMYLNTLENVSALMMPLVGLVAVNTGEVQSVAELDAHFKAFVQAKQGATKPPAAPPNTAGNGKLPPVEWLTGVQARLALLGYLTGAQTGKHDAASKAAVIAFQQKHPPLRVDGIPGPKTQAKLKEVYGS